MHTKGIFLSDNLVIIHVSKRHVNMTPVRWMDFLNSEKRKCAQKKGGIGRNKPLVCRETFISLLVQLVKMEGLQFCVFVHCM